MPHLHKHNFALPSFLLLVTLLLANISTRAQSWNTVGEAGFSAGTAWYTSIAINAAGTPYVLYKDSTYSYTANVKKFDGANWVWVGDSAFSNCVIDNASITIDAAGTPYVCYNGIFVGPGAGATVMKFNGSSWEYVGGITATIWATGYTSMAISPAGTPYIAFMDGLTYAPTYSGPATVMKFDGSSWVNVGDTSFSAGTVKYTSIAIDGSGIPYVVYQDNANGNKATVMKFDGTNWVTVGSAGFSAGVATETSVAVNSDGTPYVVYQDGAIGNKVTVMKYDGSSWSVVGSEGFSLGVADLGARPMVIDASGAPYVSYTDYANGQKATVMKFNGSSWEPVGSVGFTSGTAATAAVAIDASATPYIVYGDGNNSGKASVMKYGTPTEVHTISGAVTAALTTFPNPTQSTFTLTITAASAQNIQVIITNEVGQKIKELDVPANKPTKVHLDESAGIYFVSAMVDGAKLNGNIVIE